MHPLSSRLAMASAPIPTPTIIAASFQRSAKTSSLPITRPTGTTNNDLLVLWALASDVNDSYTLTGIAGWDTKLNSWAGKSRLLVQTKVASGETETLGSVVPSASTADLGGVCLCLRNASYDNIGSRADTENVNTITLPSVSVGYSGSFLLAFVGRQRAIESSSGIPGMTTIYEDNTSVPFLGIYYQPVGAGASGTRTWSGTTPRDAAAGIMLSVKRS